jgi:membrane-associated phospholipid phosphatase
MKDRPEYENQALWAVDPDVSVEGVAALPQPGRLGIPPFIRRQRGAEEGQTYEDREARRRQREQSWGPPRADLDRRTALLALVATAGAMAVAIVLFGLSLQTDRFLLILLVPALVLGRGRLYLRDFGLFALLMLIYSELRGLAHLISPNPFYTPQLDLDRWLFGGTPPTVVLQQWWWHGTAHWYDTLMIDVSKLHAIVPTLLAFALWTRRRALFFRFASTMLTLCLAAAITFAVFPAAPPWAAGHALITPTVTQIDDSAWSAVPSSISLSSLVQSNPYAAIPSLHGGFAFLVFLFLAGLAWPTRWRWPTVAVGLMYVLALSFARVYTGDHYVIDLVIGYAYAAVAYICVNRYWRRHELPG